MSCNWDLGSSLSQAIQSCRGTSANLFWPLCIPRVLKGAPTELQSKRLTGSYVGEYIGEYSRGSKGRY